MNWFDTSGLTSLAKTALKEAQKTIDKALDIQDTPTPSPERPSSPVDSPARAVPVDFLSSWGLTTSGETSDSSTIVSQPITESPSKTQTQSIWGSFAGSFFEPHQSIGEPADANTEQSANPNDPFSGSKLVVAEPTDGSESTNALKRDRRNKTEDAIKLEEKAAARLNRLSIVSCDSGKNSSESVEVLGSQVTTPDSEGVSMPSTSHSSSIGPRHPSESVEILPDSLMSPSIECVGFDSCGTRTECSSTNISPLDENPDKTTPTGEIQTGRTADSVSLVAEDDDDTISYNSVSECTAPTILDTHGDDKTALGPNPRHLIRDRMRLPDIKDIPLEQIASSLISGDNYASSNDGSWSDRTLNAEDSDVNIDDKKPKVVQREDVTEETYTDKLSDCSSYYNVNMATEASGSENATFVSVDKSVRSSDSGSPKDKERVSPISSESRSELVKIGSDRTSTHTSGDELETATSSDIEIIPSPNGDNGQLYYRSSPAKYSMKNCKLDASSPHLVDLVLGKSVATKIRGHNRELSEASIQSNTSDESHNSENDRLLRRLCEMSEILEMKDCRLAELSRVNVELADCNAQLKSQLESLKAKHEAGDYNSIAEDYAHRMSALEKKFQQAIREKDTFRKQLDTLKTESSSRRTSELETVMKEKDEMIAQLQEEGEKLSKQQFTQSNIIKKLRVKEKENEQVIKSLRDKIAEQTSELDRLKRSISAKAELEVSQIEAVYKLTTANKKLDSELEETKSILDDTLHKLSTTKTSLDAARKELLELQRSKADMKRRRDALDVLEQEKQQADAEIERLTGLVESLRAKIVQDESRYASREERLRREVCEARAAAAEGRGGGAEGAGGGGGALLAQLAALQQSALERDSAHRAATERLARALAEAEKRVTLAAERERAAREESAAEAAAAEAARGAAAEARGAAAQAAAEAAALAAELDSTRRALERVRAEEAEEAARVAELARRLEDVERQLREERERRTSVQMQEPLVATRTTAGDVSPSHSLASDSLSASLWTQEDGSERGAPLSHVHGLEEVLSRLTRREGEARALAATAAAAERRLHAVSAELAATRENLHSMQGLREQYDTLLQMYGEKEEQSQELQLDLQDVTSLYKSQLDEIIALKRQLGK